MSIDLNLIDAIPDRETRMAVITLWEATRDDVRDLNRRLDDAENEIRELRGIVARLR
jgi:hypothetical protein